MTTQKKPETAIGEYRLANLVATVWMTEVQTDDGHPQQVEFTLTISRTDGDPMLGEHEYRLDDMPIVARLTQWGLGYLEEIYFDAP